MSKCYPVATACLAAIMISGCMGQSMPDVADLAKPTRDAFARFGSWRPWQPAQAETVTSAIGVESAPLAPPARQPSVVVQAPRAAAQPRRVNQVPQTYRPSTRPARGQQVPSAISCQTIANPGQRVRMECTTVN